MKIVAPDYYNEFACIKGDCRHSCCVGWEIDIDADSLERFRSMKGEMGELLQKNISETEEGACFRLTEDERCPFLNGEGLCDLILALGEDCLCQICDDHPRFRNFFADREEIGLGLCCEAAGRLILGREDAVKMCTVDDDGIDEELPDEEAELFDIRNDLISIVQDRSIAMETRFAKILEYLDTEYVCLEDDSWIQFLLGLERMDESWADRLTGCKELRMNHSLPEWDLPFEQLMVYLLYRHIPATLEDDDLTGHIAYVCFAWMLVRSLFASVKGLDFEELVEICRLYSSELEYSDENIAAVIERLHELNPEL